MKKVIIFSILLAFFSPLFGKQSKNKLRLRLYGDVKTVDWHHVLGNRSLWIIKNIMEGLVYLDKDGKMSKVLAEDISISSNNKVYTFTIKKNIKWSDGKELTSEDFYFSWKRLLSPKTAGNYSDLMYEIIGAKDYASGKLKNFSKVGIQVLGKYKLRVKLNRSYPDWHKITSKASMFPMRGDVVSKFENDWTKPENIVTLGPYKLVARKIGSELSLRAFDDYHGVKAKIPEIKALVIEDEKTAIRLFSKSRLDVVQLTGFSGYQKYVKPESVHRSGELGVMFMGMLATDPNLKNVHLRRAINYAINREAFPKVLGETMQPAYRFVPPIAQATEHKLIQFDLKKAKSELKLAKFDISKPIRFDMADSGDNKAIAELIQVQLKQNLGLKVEINSMDLNLAHHNRKNHKSPLYLTSMGVIIPSPYYYLKLFADTDNFSNWKSKEYVELLEASLAMPEKTQQKTLRKVEQILIDQSPMAPLGFFSMITLVNPKIKSYRTDFLDIGDLKYAHY